MEQFEEQLHQDLHQFLLSMKEIDARLPECPDVEEKWEEIAKAYIPDGIKEFNDFPSASLGWMTYIGMAVAKFWDTEWEVAEQREQSGACSDSAESRRNSTEGQNYLKSEIIRAAQIAKNAGADIPDSIGFKFTSEAGGMFAAPINGGMLPQMQGGQPPKGMRPMRGGMGRKQVGEYITDLDMQKYLNYVVSTQALKGVPAFDSQIEGINKASGENEEFGDETGNSVRSALDASLAKNFTDYTAQKNGTTITDAIRQNVRLMNPMSFIGDGKTSVAPHWYIRHGARDRDTAFPVPVNFATKLQNAGKDVNFLLAWNRPHSGDYALDELFRWIADITK